MTGKRYQRTVSSLNDNVPDRYEKKRYLNGYDGLRNKQKGTCRSKSDVDVRMKLKYL